MQADEGTEPYESTASPADEKSDSFVSGKMPCTIEGAGSISHLSMSKEHLSANENGTIATRFEDPHDNWNRYYSYIMHDSH